MDKYSGWNKKLLELNFFLATIQKKRGTFQLDQLYYGRAYPAQQLHQIDILITKISYNYIGIPTDFCINFSEVF